MVISFLKNRLKPLGLFIVSISILFSVTSFCYADSSGEVASAYVDQLIANFDMTESQATAYAVDQVNQLLEQMEGAQTSAEEAIAELETRVEGIHKDNTRKDDAEKALEKAQSAVSDFLEVSPSDHLSITTPPGNALPTLEADGIFSASQVVATSAMSEVNKVLVLPEKPDSVPDVPVFGFLAQAVRQLFRFAWIAILISLTVSGIYFVISFDNEERITNAKNMLVYSLVGFAFVALAFALVKAITDIDFFAFI